MNRLPILFVGLSMLAVACSDSGPTAPSDDQRATTTFTVPLSSANEVPPVTNADGSASGTATIALTVLRSATGDVTSATMTIQISVNGLPAGTTITKAHLHNGSAGANAGIYVDANLASGELAIANGSGSITKSGINVPADRAVAILANPAGHYFNVHTALNPDGALRGQLSAGSTTQAPGTSSPY